MTRVATNSVEAVNQASTVLPVLQTLDPTTVGFTQSSVSFGKAGASYNLDTLIKSMATDGWVGKLKYGTPTNGEECTPEKR